MITSLQNQRIKDVVKLSNTRERRKQNLFVIEGARELSMAIEGGYKIKSLFVCDELLSDVGATLAVALATTLAVAPTSSIAVAPAHAVATEKVSVDVFRKMAYRDESDGIIALSEPRELSLEEVRLSQIPFIIVLEAVEKPGNLGAILRTADAARVDAVIVCDPKTDIYNPNTIRSSIGCVFTQQIVACTSEDALLWLKQKRICIFASTPPLPSPQGSKSNSELYFETDFNRPVAIVMGTEAEGLTDFWIKNADRCLKIPMHGFIDSLNVSVSTAVITFEAMRQKIVVSG